MSAEDEKLMAFEQRVRQALRQSADVADARVRSRLNQARQRAVSEAEKPQRSLRPAGLLPAMGALTAALLVALVLSYQTPRGTLQVAVDRPTADDLDLLADGDGLDIVQSDDGSFYEWAMSQADGSQAPGGSGSGV